MDEAREFRFVVEKAYSIPGRGIVVTGRIEKGRISVGDDVGFLGGDGRYMGGQVAAIEVSRRLVEVAEAGQEASLLLQGIKKGKIVAGTVLTAAPEAPPVPVAPSPTEMGSYPVTTPSPTASTPYSAEPIHPGSSFWRTAFYIVIGIFIILFLLFYLGKWDPKKWDPKKWDPRKRFTNIQHTSLDIRLDAFPFSPSPCYRPPVD